ncbi:MAG TPA: lysophospholipid acyltransferase family protein [Streptosporangiaceae bacterium]|nr:lysophospholipid acyltransferase family protein [Streptosporangiaceae bacterium]
MFYWVVKAVLAPILRLLFRPWVEDADYVPKTGPAILASNHLSFSDHFFAPLPLPRKVVFLAKSEYFTGRGIKGLFSRAFFSGIGQIPVDRSGGEASERALATGLRVLANGHLLGIYPEGTRTPDGRLFRGKTGVARLALEARCPVIPCAMIGGFEFQPPGKLTPQFRVRPGVKFGKPLDFSRYYGMENDKLVLRAVTDEIIYAIMKLSGQEYVDEYAAVHKARKHAEKRALKHDAAAKEPPAPDSAAAGAGSAGTDVDSAAGGAPAPTEGAPTEDSLAAGARPAAVVAADDASAGEALASVPTADGVAARAADRALASDRAAAKAADGAQVSGGAAAKAGERAPATEGAADSSASGA